jgi:RsiW-degrading membrane proteinase PrsW (M82 family)
LFGRTVVGAAVGLGFALAEAGFFDFGRALRALVFTLTKSMVV